MNTLRELVGKKVTFNYRDEQHQDEIRCTVLDVMIDDSHFDDKGEPIYITVSLMADETYNEDFIDFEDFHYVDISNITK